MIVLVTTVLLLTLPFINQPFHQDDRDFIEFARASANDITIISIDEYTLGGKSYSHFRNPHGPLLTTYLGMSLRLGADESEALFHGLYLVFPLICAVSMFFLAKRFTSQTLIAALLLLFTPGFLVMSHTIMGNLPGLSMGLAAASLYIWGTDKENSKLLIASSIAMAMAILTAYQTVSLIPALLLYAFMSKSSFKKYLPFLILAVGGAIWLLAVHEASGRLPATSYKIRGQEYNWPGVSDYNLQPVPILTFLAGASIFPLSLAVIFIRKKGDLLIALLAAALLGIWAFFLYGDYEETGILEIVQVAFLAGVGFMILYRMTANGIAAIYRVRSKGSTDAIFLLCWSASVLIVYLLIKVPYVSVRHLLLLFPPVILLFINEAERFLPRRGRLRILFLVSTLALTLVGGLAASIADYRSASIYPKAARQLAEQFGQNAEGGNTVFVRGEYGFRYYLEKQGFPVFNDKSEIKTGDIIFFSKLSSSSIVPWPDRSYKELARLEFDDAYPFRVWNWWASAGFYGHRMGPLPLAISQDIHDRIIVYQVY